MMSGYDISYIDGYTVYLKNNNLERVIKDVIEKGGISDYLLSKLRTAPNKINISGSTISTTLNKLISSKSTFTKSFIPLFHAYLEYVIGFINIQNYTQNIKNYEYIDYKRGTDVLFQINNNTSTETMVGIFNAEKAEGNFPSSTTYVGMAFLDMYQLLLRLYQRINNNSCDFSKQKDRTCPRYNIKYNLNGNTYKSTDILNFFLNGKLDLFSTINLLNTISYVSATEIPFKFLNPPIHVSNGIYIGGANYTVKQLRLLAKSKGLKGISRMRKQELINTIQEFKNKDMHRRTKTKASSIKKAR